MDHPQIPAPSSGDDHLRTGVSNGNGTRPPRPALDPVDVARLAAPPKAAVPRPATRWAALVFVVVLFVVLLFLGAWLAARARSSGPATVPSASIAHALGSAPKTAP